MKLDKQNNLVNRRVIINHNPMRPLIHCQGQRGRVLQIIGNRYKIHFPKAERTYNEERNPDALWYNREDFTLCQ